MSWRNLIKILQPQQVMVYDEDISRHRKGFHLTNGEAMTAAQAFHDIRNVYGISAGTLYSRLSRNENWRDPEKLWSLPNKNMARSSRAPKRYKTQD
jgi:hypothetical protein